MTVDQFVNKYNGVHIDEDGYYGAQCWDVVARYAREVYGCPSMPTVSGGAEGIYREFASPLPQYFDRVANSPDPNQVPPKGAIVVFEASFSPPWGHTAVVVGADSSGIDCFEQNGNDPGGVAYIKRRGWTGVSGWLVPKPLGEEMSKTDLTIMRILSFGILGRNSGNNNALSGGVDADLNNHVGAETNGKIWQLYDSEEGKNWRDRTLPRLLSADDRATALGSQLTQANGQLTQLNSQIQDLSKRPTQKQLDDLQKTASDAVDQAKKAQADLEVLQGQSTKDQETGNSFLRWLGNQLNKLTGSK